MRAAWRSVIAAIVAIAVLPASAGAVITITPGPDTVSTPRLTMDFGDAGANVERLDNIQWQTSGGAPTANLTAATGTGGCDAPFAPEHWGQAGSAAGPPQPVGDGSQGGWVARGGRTVEISSFRSTTCSGDTVVNPVRTRYTFFNVGDAAGKVRVERRFSFSMEYGAQAIRAYAPRMPLTPYSTVVHPNAAGSTLVTETILPNASQTTTDWQSWYAIENPATRAGVLVLRQSTGSNQLRLESDATTNVSAIDVAKPVAGWTAGLTETQWLCFYDATSWPVPSRSATNLPSGCSIVTVPINTAAPAIVASPRVGDAITATSGTWDNAATLSLQWLRCSPGCAAIPGATNATYTPTLADEGKSLRVDVTATAAGGEADLASSGLTAAVASGVPQNTALPKVTGEARNDEYLFANPGTWGDAPTSFKYQWRRCASALPESCVDVPGATATTYKATQDDVGARMRVRVIGVNGLGDSLPAESAPTGEVQPLVVRAVLSMSPNPSCTGATTTFDASGSKTPNPPLTRYQLSYKILPTPALIGIIFAVAFGGGNDATPAIRKYLEGVGSIPVYDGTKPATDVTFSWNRQLTKPEVSTGKTGDYARDPVVVTLTVTDKAGAKSTSDFNLLEFSQSYSSQSRKDCPRSIFTKKFAFAVEAIKATFSTKAATVYVPCALKIDCAGSFALYTVIGGKKGRSAAKKPVLLASSKVFNVRPKKRAGVKAKWTSAGSRLAKRKKPFLATLKITSVNATTGKRSVKTKTLTVKP